MPDDTPLNPCKRCHGSGTEPDPVADATRDLNQTIGILVTDRQVAEVLHAKALTLSMATALRILNIGERSTELEAALRDILHRLPDPLLGDETIWRARNDDVANWRKILGDDS